MDSCIMSPAEKNCFVYMHICKRMHSAVMSTGTNAHINISSDLYKILDYNAGNNHSSVIITHKKEPQLLISAPAKQNSSFVAFHLDFNGES